MLKPVLHFGRWNPLAHPFMHLPSMWLHVSLLTQCPQLLVHFFPNVFRSHSEIQNKKTVSHKNVLSKQGRDLFKDIIIFLTQKNPSEYDYFNYVLCTFVAFIAFKAFLAPFFTNSSYVIAILFLFTTSTFHAAIHSIRIQYTIWNWNHILLRLHINVHSSTNETFWY